MKATAKAKELFDKYCYAIRQNEDDDGYFTNTIHAKRCVLISLEFAREFITGDLSESFDKTMYLFEIKQEIEKL